MSPSEVSSSFGNYVTRAISSLQTFAQTTIQEMPSFLQMIATKATKLWFQALPDIQTGASLLMTRAGVAGLCFGSGLVCFALAKDTHHTATAISSAALGVLALFAASYLFMTSGLFPTPAFLQIPSTG